MPTGCLDSDSLFPAPFYRQEFWTCAHKSISFGGRYPATSVEVLPSQLAALYQQATQSACAGVVVQPIPTSSVPPRKVQLPDAEYFSHLESRLLQTDS